MSMNEHIQLSSGGQPCPVQASARRAAAAGEDFLRRLRQLRRDLRACRQCEVESGCPLLMEINSAIDIAIDEVNEEWGFR